MVGKERMTVIGCCSTQEEEEDKTLHCCYLVCVLPAHAEAAFIFFLMYLFIQASLPKVFNIEPLLTNYPIQFSDIIITMFLEGPPQLHFYSLAGSKNVLNT